MMSRSDRLKEEVAWLKVLSAAFMALDALLITWLARNYETATRLIVIGACVLAVAFTCFVVAAFVRVYCCIRSMEAL